MDELLAQEQRESDMKQAKVHHVEKCNVVYIMTYDCVAFAMKCSVNLRSMSVLMS